MNLFGNYTKIVTALVGSAIAWATIVVQSSPTAISGSEWLAGGVLLATALGLYGGTNAPKAP